MPACALCENVQVSGEACEVCGHPFAPDQSTTVTVEPLEGLERTILDPVAATEESVPELEATSAAPVQVVVSPMEDLQPTQVEGIPSEGADEAPSARTCRYCQNPALAGEGFCGHCGMRLPSVPGGVEPPAPGPTLCRDCGTPMKGSGCPGCGARATG